MSRIISLYPTTPYHSWLAFLLSILYNCGAMKTTLSQVEAQLQRLVEGSLNRLFPVEWKNNRLASHLLEAMRNNLLTEENQKENSLVAPDLYTIFLPAQQVSERTTNRQLCASLAHNLLEATQGSEIKFRHTPIVQMAGDSKLLTGQVRVKAHFQPDDMSETQSFLPPLTPHEMALPFINGFLIFNQVEVFPLENTVVTLGRQWDADLIVDDTRVSRLHAQIRMVDGRYVVFDLGSTGGTFVNGERIQQRVLFRGDVLSLAGVDLIFGQDEIEEDETKPMKNQVFRRNPLPERTRL
ncbi:MAG: DUF3662 domain-containing protein [Anaerolineae bacterium]|nr:DUF3662 domain-containing protein [Anaerolineae bacterium]